jgi:aldose 1-epimerase
MGSATGVASAFGCTPEGDAIELYTLTNAHGMRARIATYGAIITELTAADRDGRYRNVVLGFDSLADYLSDTSYCGAIVGRCAGRIARATFMLHDRACTLLMNDRGNSLHGGTRGFDKSIWRVADAQRSRLRLQRVSHDGEQGYPGALDVSATYTLLDDDALQVEFNASSDQATVVNLTQHPYFNLRGHGDLLDHELQIHASRFTPLDRDLIPTGELCQVAGSPLDFRDSHRIGARIDAPHEQLRNAGGYDHNWVIDDWEEGRSVAVPHAIAYEANTGRVLEVSSTQPGLQFYSGNFLARQRGGFALEPQHFPDSPNQPGFPSVTLEPGQYYAHTILYRFATREQ